jgi:predicted alpha-1,2-mannosidase
MYKNNLILIIAVVFLSLFSACGNKASEWSYPVDYVNPLQGTASESDFSTGNTYPAVALPWGMNFWTPQTRNNGNGWQYVYFDSSIQGFKQTHQPSPWINDYGCFSLMPVTDAVLGQKERASGFVHDNEIAHPYYYGVKLSSGIMTELAPTNSGASFRFTYPQSKPMSIVIDCFGADGHIKIIPKQRKIIGYSKYYAPNNNAELPEGFATHFVITFDRDLVAVATSDEHIAVADSEIEFSGEGTVCRIEFGKAENNNNCLHAQVASSFIGPEQAQINYERELGQSSFEQIMNEARKIWNHELGRIEIRGGSEEQKRIFYTALYRTMLFPRKTHEYDAEGTQLHYGMFTGRVENGPMYTDNGFWDTFRAVHPFFTILYPEMSGEIMESLLNYYREGGWLPEWTSPAYKDCMIGQHSSSLVADAYAKGIQGFDRTEMLEALVKGANGEGPNATGRSGFDFYNKLGYIPYDVGVKESVSKTLEYAYNDYCIARFAELSGADSSVVNLYRRRAMNYRNIFDSSIGFVRPKDASGKWQEPYSPDIWGGSFTEGSAWHWTWCVYHDPAGLISLMGGESEFVDRLDSVFIAPSTFDATNYGREIHEMTEMVAGNMGQYAHGNQPIQHMIYLYNYAGVSYKAQKQVRKVMERLYHSGIEDGAGLCGDEDNGQTSAWYVFSALGFYPVCPGSGQYVIGSPLFKESTIELPRGKQFTVRAVNNSPQNIYIQSAMLNGVPLNRAYILHEEVVKGGVLEFKMGKRPNLLWGSCADDRPFSLSSIK